MYTCNEARNCSTICPLYTPGRECPTVDEVAQACEHFGVTLAAVLTLRVPELA